MAKYKFEQFNVEIENPTISANEDTIQLQVSKNTISVNIILETPTTRFGILLDNIIVQNLNYDGYENLMIRVNEKLKDFEIIEE